MSTVLLATFDGTAHGPDHRLPADLVRHHGTLVPVDRPDHLAGVFDCARDAAHAAIEMARRTDAGVVLATLVHGPERARPPDWVARLAPLVASVPPGRIVLTGTTAVLAGSTLPPGVDLLDRGTTWHAAPELPTERLYELRFDPDQGAGGEPSNLAWARRALTGQSPPSADALRSLTTMWQQARTGGLRTALLTGTEADTQTTTAELALRLHAEDALVIYGRWDGPTSTPYGAVREAFGMYADTCEPLRLRRDLDGLVGEVSRLLPEVGTRLGTARPPARHRPRRAEAYEAIGTWLTRTARRRPTLLVLHDLQWADPLSVGLLEHLWHVCRQAPVLVALTAVEDEGVRSASVERVLTAGVRARMDAFRRVLL